jgi:uncharacterized membrane protein (UPF0182 family)
MRGYRFKCRLFHFAYKEGKEFFSRVCGGAIICARKEPLCSDFDYCRNHGEWIEGGCYVDVDVDKVVLGLLVVIRLIPSIHSKMI